MNIGSINEALSAIAQALNSPQAQPRQSDDLRSTAIRRVWQAVDKTRMFLASVRREEASEMIPNPELITLWSEASLAMSAIDNDLADRLRMKAEFWSDPEYWTEDQIRQARIGIDEVAREARRLISAQPVQNSQGQETNSDRQDIFISHASNDKQEIAAPLANELKNLGYRVWYDEFILKLGDSLRREIDKGLALCNYGAVILSPSFFSKQWPQFELDGLLALETSERRNRILPIWHNVGLDDVVRFSPTLAGRLGVSTSRGLQYVVTQVVDVLGSRGVH
jgi:hypothetical protein